MSLHAILEQHWQRPKWWLTPLLWPLARLFQALAALRRYAYARGWLQQQHLPCAVAVVGNIHAGGVGKTPITAALASGLRARGVAVGIVSRGYGRRSKEVLLLDQHSRAADVGDEPLMLWRQTGVPVAVGAQRFQAAQALLAAHPETQLILCDDGLQHYALARDWEIVVFPAADVARRLDLLPNGGLREPLSRLHTVDALVVSQGSADDVARLRQNQGLPPQLLVCASRIQAGRLYRLNTPAHTVAAGELAGKSIAALAAIARPQRFFDALRDLGLPPVLCKALPDHAELTPADLSVAEIVIITEKDAVKLAAYDLPQVWVLPIEAHTEPDLVEWLWRCWRVQQAA
ncbi:tetraacyldisaccharide 4'-kinase [Paralysiella testudinis]|uniref:Tetraacyldisaccharide 4'-kinase n=1 Tax=Paralysiella testudinis TaxID=2809020 RepID=A0A892ZG64_9NEIS|nr:tetraacyldisaccharide 4'-kinase [Paralysiella testudinis]QRQ81633.1 tetraacyldisaccharide 4'-kinase [Paralysiella testudinis]